jgi:hypothetical protein
MPEVEDQARLAELEDELRQKDAKVKELTRELGDAQDLVDRMRRQLEDHNQLIEQWIEVFDMQQNEAGVWIFDRDQSELWEKHLALFKEHQALIRQWNKFVGDYNSVVSPRERGRPLAASDAQQAEVLKRHKAKASLRAITLATGLSMRTVRTIIDKANGTGRGAKRTNEVRRRQFDKHRAAAFRVRKAGRDRLPAEIAKVQANGAALVKEAKGLGR